MIIQRTNPNRSVGFMGETFKCCVCGKKYSTWDEGVACATKDHENKTKKGKAKK